MSCDGGVRHDSQAGFRLVECQSDGMETDPKTRTGRNCGRRGGGIVGQASRSVKAALNMGAAAREPQNRKYALHSIQTP